MNFREHRRFKAVSRILNERGFRTRNGSKFGYTTVRRLLQDPTAKGIHRTNYTKNAGNGAVALKPEHDWILHEVPAIISPECGTSATPYLMPGKAAGRRSASALCISSPASPFVPVAKRCIRPPPRQNTYARKCRNRIPAVDLEAIFIEELEGYLLSSEHIAEYLEKANATKMKSANSSKRFLQNFRK